jgi:hypothetical protein
MRQRPRSVLATEARGFTAADGNCFSCQHNRGWITLHINASIWTLELTGEGKSRSTRRRGRMRDAAGWSPMAPAVQPFEPGPMWVAACQLVLCAAAVLERRQGRHILTPPAWEPRALARHPEQVTLAG